MQRSAVYLLLTVIVLSVFIGYTFLGSGKEKHFCGDGKCEKDENCTSCASDCKCISGQYCFSVKGCMTPSCGNGVCEPFEPRKCCEDCGCAAGEICSKADHQCDQISTGITDQKVEEIIRDYYGKKNMTVVSIEFKSAGEYQGKLYKNALVTLNGQEWQVVVGVSVEGDVKETSIL
jgi:hypothetical protein